MKRKCAKSPPNLSAYQIAFLTIWKKAGYQCYQPGNVVLNCSNTSTDQPNFTRFLHVSDPNAFWIITGQSPFASLLINQKVNCVIYTAFRNKFRWTLLSKVFRYLNRCSVFISPGLLYGFFLNEWSGRHTSLYLSGLYTLRMLKSHGTCLDR